MNSEIKFQILEQEESNAVVSFSNGTVFKVDKLMKHINGFFTRSVLDKLATRLAEIGLGTPPNHKGSCSSWNNYVEAEILEPQLGEWKKGKMRMRVILEFCPNEPEEIEDKDLHQNANPLDDIRRTMT